MASLTDDEIARNNNDIFVIKELISNIWNDILDEALYKKYEPVSKFDFLKDLEVQFNDVLEGLDRLEMEPYDTPQFAVDIIGQKE